MRVLLSILISATALLLITKNTPITVQAQTAHENFRWASAGGGWRAMVANMAYANVLTQAGLFTETGPSNFSSISAQSGGSWFLAQFFFAQPFYNNATQTSPDELAQFVTNWMKSYQDYTAQFFQTEVADDENTTTTTNACDDLKTLNGTVYLQTLIDHCVMLVALRGDWARFVSEMLDQAARDYYGISSTNETTNSNYFLSRTQVAPNSRVPALQQTDFYIQTVLTANSRIRGNATENVSDIGVYIGHSLEDETVYTLPIGLQYQISGAQGTTGYLTSSPDESFPDLLVTYTADISPNFTFSDYLSYGLYPGTVEGLMRTPVPENATLVGGFNLPFDEPVPTIGQLCGASSAAIGTFSGLVPSTMAQAFSFLDFAIYSSNQTDEEKMQAQVTLDAALNAAFYSNPLLDDVSVCSQWPNLPCGVSDGRFIDGEFSDSPTLGLNIANFQTVQNGALSQTLKILVTPGNIYESIPIGFVSYFKNSFNQDIEPGEYYWPSTAEQGPLTHLPIYSPQLFQETLDIDTYVAMLQPIDGLPSVSTVTIQATTITNPIFKTKASQLVEIFVIQINSTIPTDIMGITSIEKWTGLLAEMASSIAASQELVNRIKEFFDPTTGSSSSSTTTPGGPAAALSNEPVPSPTIAPTPQAAASTSAAASISISLSVLVGLVSIVMN